MSTSLTSAPDQLRPVASSVSNSAPSFIDTLVRSVRIEAEDIRSFELAPLPGEQLPDWTPGAHIQVRLAGGLTRAYSLCNHPGETGSYRIAVKLEAQSRGGSRAMHGLAPGDRVQISAPRNLFGLDMAATAHVLIAGGIGVTPLYAMFNALKDHAECEMHYFARSNLHAAFSDRLSQRSHLHHGLDAEGTLQTLRALAAMHARRPGTVFYTCGPAAFMDAVEKTLAAAGIPAAQLRSERFGTEATPAKPVSGEALPSGSFRIVFARSKIEAEVTRGESIIGVARAHGVDIPSSCEQGVCGACLSDVLDGTPEHLDAYLSSAEQAGNKLILPCVSRCAGACLVIDR
ncbi:PDR/VanB family oxidoreductase [Uliginosibacterium sp. H3]|uniref:PDR/VanB family oxidoreductase n=1 Tax=Uliginosibacterium silvisoli TaxID=3114758 RepID=A0ABU6K1C0_9RHOO|nr:PDR/VanB family oxidoreductase [Uliginosibacterium sp. H3]